MLKINFKNMWLKSLIQSSDLKYLSQEQRRSFFEGTYISWHSFLDSKLINHKINSILNETFHLKWKMPQEVLLELSRKAWSIMNLREWSFSFTDLSISSEYWSERRIAYKNGNYVLILWKIGSKKELFVDFSDIIDVSKITDSVNVVFSTKSNDAVCEHADRMNRLILTDQYSNILLMDSPLAGLSCKPYPYVYVSVNNKIVWHVKLKWEKTFLSYVNTVDKNWDLSLIKWWIYSVWNRSDFTSYQVWDIQKNNYILRQDELDLRFQRIVIMNHFSYLVDQHLENFSKKPNIYI